MLALTSEIRTPFHGIRAGVKLAALSVITAGLFVFDSDALLIGAAFVAVISYLMAGKTFALNGLRMLKPLWFFAAIVLVWHAVTADFWTGAMVALRLAVCFAFANLVTLTTTLQDMTDVLLWLLSPFKRIGFPVHYLAFAIALTIRFIPVLMVKGRALLDAWRARSARAAGHHVIVPLAVLALDDADHVAEALRARGGLAQLSEV